MHLLSQFSFHNINLEVLSFLMAISMPYSDSRLGSYGWSNFSIKSGHEIVNFDIAIPIDIFDLILQDL